MLDRKPDFDIDTVIGEARRARALAVAEGIKTLFRLVFRRAAPARSKAV